VVDSVSTITVDKPDVIKGKRVLVVEDGPTMTHGDVTFGAGTLAARRFGAAEIVDPRQYAVGKLAETFKIYPNIGALLPAMGYGEQQMKDLAETIDRVDCDTVIIATPIDLQRVIKINKPSVKVDYSLQEIGRPDMEDVLKELVTKIKGSF